jgi:hypothetical protein
LDKEREVQWLCADDKYFVRAIHHLPFLFPFVAVAVAAPPTERLMESVLPALAYGVSCSSTVLLQSLTDTPVMVEVEGHRGSGALVPMAGHANLTTQLDPGQQVTYKLEIEEETTTAWVKVREKIPATRAGPVVALSGTTECRAGDQLRVASRQVAYPMRNPWFSSEITDLRGAVVTLINTSEKAARASVCYSAGNLYSVPSAAQPSSDLQPLCSANSDVQIPPFGTREFPVEHGGNSHFSLKTNGQAIVLQMLRPADSSLRIYTVDSTIQFGEEVPAGR